MVKGPTSNASLLFPFDFVPASTGLSPNAVHNSTCTITTIDSCLFICTGVSEMAAESTVAIADVAAFKAASTESPTTTHVIFFWADFQDNCKPGSQLDKLFDGLAAKYSGQCKFHKVHDLRGNCLTCAHRCCACVQVNAEEAVDAVDAFGVESVPFFVVYKVSCIVISFGMPPPPAALRHTCDNPRAAECHSDQNS